MEFLAGWAGLILGFSGLVFIHELGHFLLAKWNGVGVHVFSIGMGPYLVSYTHNGTVYALSAIPIGGYVKMLGQDDMNADLSASKNPADFRNKRPGQKAAILAAGAAFNIITTILIYAFCYWSGMAVQSPCIGNIPADKALAKAVLVEDKTKLANLQKGDRILEVGDIAVKSFFDVMLQVTAYPSGQPIVLAIQRKGSLRKEYIEVVMEEDKKRGIPNIGLDHGTVYEEEELLPLGFGTEYYTVIGSDPADLKDSAAGKTKKFKKGDRIVALEDRTDPANPVKIFMNSKNALINAASASGGKPRFFHIERDGKEIEPIEVTAESNSKEGGFRFGIEQSILKRVTKIDEKSIAYAAGLRQGDLVIGFYPDSSNINANFHRELREPWKSGDLVWATKYDGDKIKRHIDIPKQEGSQATELFKQDFVVEEYFQRAAFFDALGQSWDDTRHYTVCMFATIKNLVTGNVKPDNLSGPVGIGRSIFTVAAEQSMKKYLWWLAFISLNLGVMQLLPIPLLDGFHLVMVLVEKLKGSSVSAKIQEGFMWVGVVMVGSLLLYVMFNDVSKFFK